MTDFVNVSIILLWFFMIFLLCLFFWLAKTNLVYLRRFNLIGLNQQPGKERKGLIVGQQAPTFVLQDQAGRTVAVTSRQKHQTLLLFTMDTCNICQSVLTELPGIQEQLKYFQIVVIAPHADDQQEKVLPANISFVRSTDLLNQYYVTFVPYFVVVNPDGIIVNMDRIYSATELISSIGKMNN